MNARALCLEWLRARVPAASFAWIEASAREIAALADPESPRLPALLSLTSRYVPRGALAPSAEEIARAFDVCEGWDPRAWSLFDTARVALVLSRSDLEQGGGVRALEECFRFADVGEMVALHRSLAHVPRPERCAWRAGEGCRSSIRVVFEAAACDTPLPFRVFDDLAFRQLAVKALFVEAPLWRVYGLDRRLDEELARMALDLAEERRAAGRRVQAELWLLLGKHGGERARASIERELAGDFRAGRAGAALALARAGAIERVAELFSVERDAFVRATMESAIKGHLHQSAFESVAREAATA